MDIIQIKNSLINKGYFFPIKVLSKEDALELMIIFMISKKNYQIIV